MRIAANFINQLSQNEDPTHLNNAHVLGAINFHIINCLADRNIVLSHVNHMVIVCMLTMAGEDHSNIALNVISLVMPRFNE